MWAKWSGLEFNQRFALGSLLLFLLVMPIALYLTFSPTSPFSKAGPGCTISAPGCGEEFPATLSIEPSNINVAPGETFIADIMLDTGSHEVTAAEIVLTFDQELLEASGSGVIVGDFLPVILEEPALLGNSISGADSYRSARLRFVVGSQAETPISGYGKIATVKFAAQNNEGSSSLSLAEGSQVAAIYRQENVASETYPAKVNIEKPLPGNATVSVKVKFEGVAKPQSSFPPSPVPKPAEYFPVILESQTESGELRKDGLLLTLSPDTYTYTGTSGAIKPDTYTIYIKGPSHLRKKIVDSYKLEANKTAQFTVDEPLTTGDIVDNNEIDIFDYNMVIQNYGPRKPNVQYADGDLDRDGDVDIFDYNFVIQNFGRAGD